MTEVSVLVIESRHGTEVSVWRSEDLAMDSLIEWIEMGGRDTSDLEELTERDQRIEQYFEDNADEWYRIDSLTVGGPQDLEAVRKKPHGYRRYDWEFEESRKNVSVTEKVHPSGVFVLDLDTGGGTDIDIDIDGETVAIIRNGEAITE